MTTKNTGLLDRLAKQAVHLPEEIVPVPEWGGDVTLRGFTSRERDRFEEDNLRRASGKAGNGVRKRGVPVEFDMTNLRARLVARTIVENGERTFATPEGEELLGNQSATILDRLFSVAQRLHGMTNADIEELAGNSEAMEDSEQNTAEQETAGVPSLN